MQPDPVDSSTKMVSAVADHGWDEQDQHESDKYKDLLLLKQKLEWLGIHDDLERSCNQELERLRQQAFLDSLPKNWEGLNRMAIKALEDGGMEQGFDNNLPTQEIVRRFEVKIELAMEAYEQHMRYIQYSMAMLEHQLESRSQIDQRQLQVVGIEHAYLPTPDHLELQSFSSDDPRALAGVDTNASNPLLLHIRRFYLSPKVDNRLEAKHKPMQMEPDSGLARNKAPPNTMLQTKEPDVTITRTMPMLFGIPHLPSDVMQKFLESESPEPGTIHKYNHGRRKRPYSEPFNTWTKKKTGGSITTNPRPGENGFVLHSADAKGNRVRKNISVISRADNGGSNSEGTTSLTGGNNHHRGTDSAYDILEVILDNQAHVHCAGNFNVLSNLSIGSENVVLIAANGAEMETFMSGSVHLGNIDLPNVYYCPDLGNRIIVSGSMLDNDDYGYEFRQGKFTVKDLKNGTTVGEGHLVDGNYILEYLKISGDRTRVPQQPGLVTTVWNALRSALHRLGLK